jgi:hypothetical protein
MSMVADETMSRDRATSKALLKDTRDILRGLVQE